MNLLLQIMLCCSSLLSCAFAQEHITDAACDPTTRPVIATANKVSLLSPNFPGYYNNSEFCQWTLRPGDHISTIYLHIEQFSTENFYDTVRVYNSRGSLLLNLYGTSPWGRTYHFQETELRVEFRSDGSVIRSGFKINYRAEDILSRPDIACNPLTLPANINGSTAMLQPLGSRDREYCFWVFKAELGSDDDPEGLYVGLNNVENLESGQLAIYEGEGKSGRVLFEYRESLQVPSVLWMRDTQFSVEYSSILDTNGSFNISIFPRDGACESGTAREISMPYGSTSLQSPGYPHILPDYLSCNWIITTLPGQTITAYKTELDLDTDQFCDRDYLEVLDGKDAMAHSFGRFCDRSPFQEITSTGNSLQIILRSDRSYSHKKGFDVMFTINAEEGSGGSMHQGSPLMTFSSSKIKLMPKQGVEKENNILKDEKSRN